MQNQENAHSDATEKSLISKDKSILSSDSESAQNFPLGLFHRLYV
jgi:hypothetical protein